MSKKNKDALPESMSAASIRFFESQRRLTDFLSFTLQKIQQPENAEEWKLDALIRYAGDKSKKNVLTKTQSKEIEEHLSLVCELVACKSVDNFLIYLSELLALVLSVYPKVLDLSKVQIDLAVVLAQPDIQTIRIMYIERKIREMSYWSLKDLSVYLKEKFKFKLFDEEADRQLATNAIEERNLLVHNKGVVDRIFKEKAPTHPANIGDRIKYGPKKLLDCIKLVERLTISIDQRALSQWPLLPKVKHSFKPST